MFNIFILCIDLGKDFKNKFQLNEKQDVENHFHIGNITNIENIQIRIYKLL